MPSIGKVVEQFSYITSGNGKCLAITYKIKTLLIYKQAMLLLYIYSREMRTCVLTRTGVWMFTADLFIITPHWRQPKYPSTGKWMDKLWYVHAVECYLLIKRNTCNNVDESHSILWKKGDWEAKVHAFHL